MVIPLSIQLDLQIHQPDQPLDQNQTQTQDHIISLDSDQNENNNEKLISSNLITVPKVQKLSDTSKSKPFTSSELKALVLHSLLEFLIWYICLSFWRILNELPSTLQTQPLSNLFKSSTFDWNFLDKLSNVEYIGKDSDLIFSTTTIPTRSHTRNWLLESSQVNLNAQSNSQSKSNPNPNADFNLDSTPNNDFNSNINGEPSSNPYSIYEDSGISSTELKEELTKVEGDLKLFKSKSSSRIPQTSEDDNPNKDHSDNLNIFNDLEDPLPLPSTKPDPSHELDFLL